MKIELSDDERDYLSDKTFWDWKRVEIDVMVARDPRMAKEEVRRYWAKQEKFYRDLYNRLKLEGE